MRRALPLALALTIACAGAEPAAYTIDTLPNDVVHVVNHGPSGWTDTLGWKLSLEAEHTFGLDDPGSMNYPNYPHRLSSGRFVVLNQIPPFIQIYDSMFTPLARVGRKGSGPGEFVNPDLGVYGDSIVVFDGGRGVLLLFDGDGTYLQEHLVSGFPDRFAPRDRAGRLPLLGRYLADDRPGVKWWSLTERRAVDSVGGPVSPPEKMAERCRLVLPYQPELEMAPTRAGLVWYGVSDGDRFVLTRTGRDTVRIAETPGRPRFPVDPARLDEMFDPNGFFKQQCGDDLRREDVPTQRPAWHWLVVDDDDNLWVQRPSAYGGGFDVYDPEGRFLGEVPSPLGSEENEYWQGNGMMSVERLEEGGYTLRWYRIQRH